MFRRIHQMKRIALAFALPVVALADRESAGSMGKKDIIDTAVAAGNFKTLAAAQGRWTDRHSQRPRAFHRVRADR